MLYPKKQTIQTVTVSYKDDKGNDLTRKETKTITTRDVIDVHAEGVLENIIQNMTLYKDIKTSSIRNIFNAEMSKVRKGFEKQVGSNNIVRANIKGSLIPVNDYFKKFDTGFVILDYLKYLVLGSDVNPSDLVGTAGKFNADFFNAIISTTFNIIDEKKAIENVTGNFISSVPLVIGYSYYADKKK
jgi:hypothetical protein